ncbi:hypothetical protein HNO92_003038 [Chromobacterium alkanivorans]|uniref:hypothetical protein n=1 Tax=Chromobacterium TaxID=535 RepID=UPI0012E1E64C|nr:MULTISPECIES: hypothetical protein [Chromobacterium]MCS3805821.1 hypothetical protein [Chromobacterium alkanivorans]MCS3819949.1 hypothetical protein [Chromobacterium alkanivorans]MCS3874706.1 hypothetical protein [Chromobacterium alkanivorans]
MDLWETREVPFFTFIFGVFWQKNTYMALRIFCAAALSKATRRQAQSAAAPAAPRAGLGAFLRLCDTDRRFRGGINA